ncbi:MAG: MFS transporter [Oscillospiraceae bacterium]|nr:MFS transporter [Oscillospiraceae bacterium]
MENTVIDREEQQQQEVKHVSVREQMAFNASALLRDMSRGLFIGQLQTFWIMVMGNDALMMGPLQVLQRIWDGFTDPAVGAYFDRQTYTTEKARRFFKKTAIPLTVLLVLMFLPIRFHAQDSINVLLHMGFIMLLYLPFDPMESLNGTAFHSYYNSITPNVQERNGVIARSRMFSSLGGAAVGGIPMIFGWFTSGPDDVAGRTRIFMIAVAVVGVAFLLYNLLMYTQVKERIVSPPQTQQQKILRIFRGLLKNRLFLILVLSNTIGGIINRGGTDVFLFEYNLGDISWHGYVGLIGGFPALLIATWLMPKLCQWFEKRDIVIGSSIARLIIRGTFLFMGTRPGMFNLTGVNTAMSARLFFTASAFLNEIPNAVRGQLYWSMLADSVDYGEWKTGKRNDGVVYTTEGLMGKLIGSVGAMSTGIILRTLGFVEQAPAQSARTMHGLFVVPMVIELISITCSTIPFFFWNVTRKQHAQVIADIAARNETVADTAAEEPVEAA